MNISRKEFFKKTLRSLGEAVFTVKDALQTPAEVTMNLPDCGGFVAAPQEGRVAAPHNEGCLAKNSGCFACVEHCETGAIKLIPGIGVRINLQLCNGCGSCEYICPVTPKAVRMMARQSNLTASAD